MKRLLAAVLFCLSLPAIGAVNLNTASQTELESVKGIGPAKAKAILAHRDKNGPFATVDDLKKVKGFGDASVARLKGELTVGGESPARKSKP